MKNKQTYFFNWSRISYLQCYKNVFLTSTSFAAGITCKTIVNETTIYSKGRQQYLENYATSSSDWDQVSHFLHKKWLAIRRFSYAIITIILLFLFKRFKNYIHKNIHPDSNRVGRWIIRKYAEKNQNLFTKFWRAGPDGRNWKLINSLQYVRIVS